MAIKQTLPAERKESFASGKPPVRHEMNLRFISPRGKNPKGMKAVEEVYHRVLAPMYGCQEAAVAKLIAGLDRECRIAYDPKNDPSTARGLIAYKTAPTREHAAYGLNRSFELKTFLLMKSDDNDAVGYGTEMLRYAAIKALESGAETMHITVSEEVASSSVFFIRRGFQLVISWKGRYKEGVTEHLLAMRLRAGNALLKAKPLFVHACEARYSSGDRKLQRVSTEFDSAESVACKFQEIQRGASEGPVCVQESLDRSSFDTAATSQPPAKPLKPLAMKIPLSSSFFCGSSKQSTPAKLFSLALGTQQVSPAPVLATNQIPGVLFNPIWLSSSALVAKQLQSNAENKSKPAFVFAMPAPVTCINVMHRLQSSSGLVTKDPVNFTSPPGLAGMASGTSITPPDTVVKATASITKGP